MRPALPKKPSPARPARDGGPRPASRPTARRLNAVALRQIMAAYGYVRVSTARQAEEGLSLDVQRRQIEGYALMQGLGVERVFVEEGVSGSVPMAERPAGGELVAVLEPGDAVIAAK